MRPATLLLTAAALGLPASALRAETPVSLERTLVRAAPDVVAFCKAHNYKTVGVLKFLVHKAGQGKLSDNAGTLNRTVARQLEMGLILANDAMDPIGIIDDASDVAAKTPGANHLTKEGRLKLFEARYPLAWGKEQVSPDAFLTGIVGVDAGLKTLTLKLVAFDKATNALVPVLKDKDGRDRDLVALNDPRKLSEMGESFSRGAFDDGAVDTAGRERQEAAAMDKAAQVRQEAAPGPAKDAAAPVRLDVLYDGRAVPVEQRGGTAFLPEPNEGQKVTFRLRRGTGTAVFACVLKVNGENTLFREKAPDLHCRKWLLYPEDKAGVVVQGFQRDDKTTQQFRVLSKAESKAREIDYGADVGTVTLTVFKDLKGRPPGGDLSEETQGTKVLEKAKVPARKPDNFNALTAQLIEEANSSRGLIAEGNTVDNGITVVKSFTADPTPVMALTLAYYKK